MSKLKRLLEDVHLCEQSFQNGRKYEQLTWQDIQRIVKIADGLLAKESKTEQLEAEFQTEESYYKEILKRFKEAKSCGSH